MSRLLLAGLFLSSVLQIPAAPPQAPGNTTSGGPVAAIGPDPAAVKFVTETGVLLVAVKVPKIADYEAAIVALQELLSKTTDPAKRALAESWWVYKAADLDANGNAIYVHVIQPAVPDTDYRPSLLLDELLAGAPAELLAKYRDAFAGPPAKLALAELAHMSVAPVPKPTNASPGGPAPPGKPGNVSPPTPGNVTPPTPGNVTPPKPGNVSPPTPGNVTPPTPGNVTPPAPGNATPPAPKKPPGRQKLRLAPA